MQFNEKEPSQTSLIIAPLNHTFHYLGPASGSSDTSASMPSPDTFAHKNPREVRQNALYQTPWTYFYGTSAQPSFFKKSLAFSCLSRVYQEEYRTI